MQNHNDRDVEILHSVFDQFQDLQLIADIQISGRLIQEQKFGILVPVPWRSRLSVAVRLKAFDLTVTQVQKSVT